MSTGIVSHPRALNFTYMLYGWKDRGSYFSIFAISVLEIFNVMMMRTAHVGSMYK